MATFASGFGKGVVAGAVLHKNYRESRKERNVQDAMAILGEFENHDPFVGEFDASAQGVPEEGQPAKPSNRGFDGLDVDDMQKRYFAAIGNFTTMDDYAKAKDAWGVAKAGKITENLDGAIAAYRRGDMEGAKKLFRGASAYISPGTTPEIEIDPKSGGVIVANYDKAGNPSGGGMIDINQLESLRSYYQNPDTWADRKQRHEEFTTTEGRMWEQFGLTKKVALAELELAQAEDARQALEHTATLADTRAQERYNTSRANVQEATAAGQIAATNATSAATVATQGEEERKAATAKVAEARAELDRLNVYSEQLQKKILEERAGTGGVDMNAAWGTLTQGESSNDPNAVSSKGASGLGQIMADNIVPWAREQLPQYVGGMSDEQIRSLYAESEDFQDQLGKAKFADILQGEAKGSLQDAYSIWHSGDPYAVAIARGANDIVNGKGMTTEAYVNKMMTGYQQRTGGAGGTGGGDQRVAIKEPVDLLGSTDEEKKPPEDRLLKASWLYSPPNEAGEQLLRPGIDAMVDDLLTDLNTLNPEETPTSLGHMANGAFSPADQSTKVLEPDENGDIYVTNGVDKMKISADSAGMIEDYRETSAQALLSAAPADRNRPDAQQWAPAPEAAGIPDMPMPTQETVGPTPGQVPGGPAVSPHLASEGITAQPQPQPGAASAAAASVNPYAAPEMGGAPRAIDDTASGGAARAPAARQVPTAAQASVLVQVPQLAQAVQAWIAAGASQQGAEFTAMRQIVSQLPPEIQNQAMQEIIQARQAGGR